jgi:prophage regulatory protein
MTDTPPAPWLLPEHLVGGAEIRELVGGIERNTLIAWRRDRGFPEPVARLAIGEVWDLRAVKDWMRRR